MELKCASDAYICQPMMGSNRTFMELKYALGNEIGKKGYRSNRTFMELKYTDTAALTVLTWVLIVPLWN